MSPLVSLEVYVAAVALASVVLLAFAAWLHRDAESRPAQLIVYWAGLQSVVGILTVGQVLAPSEALARPLLLVGTAIGSATPIVATLFVLAYTGRTRWLSRRSLAVIGAWYVVLAGLVLTDPVFGLAYTEYVDVAGPVAHAYGMPTGLFMLLSAPLWVLTLLPPVLLWVRASADSGITRAQSATLAAGFTVPIVVLVLWMGQILPGPANGAFVVGGVLTVLAVGFAIRRYHLFDLVPLAREMVYDELDDAVLVVDRHLRLLDYNRGAVETFPDLAAGAGERIGDLLPVVDEDGAGDEGAAPFVERFTIYGENEPRTFEVSVSYLPNERQFQGYGLIVRDVTDQRRRMHDLEQQTTQLERFASTLSHDIRNPLHVAGSHLELLAEDVEHESIGKATTAVDRIEQIVDDLLTLSREGRAIDDREFVSLVDVAESAWETTRTADATLTFDADPDASVYADETRLRNVFENLFRNAIEFGGPAVVVRVGSHADGFYVEDDGPGVPPDRRDDVFEYEFTTAESGTGLGLAIVESIASAHGWDVSVTDGANGGARFVFAGVTVVTDPPAVDAPTSEGISDAPSD